MEAAVIFAATNGYLDTFAPEDVSAIEVKLQEYLSREAGGVLIAIRESKEIREESEKTLRESSMPSSLVILRRITTYGAEGHKNEDKATERTHKVTRAMEAVSAVKMRKTQQSALAGRPYARAALGVLARLSGSAISLVIRSHQCDR